MKNKGYTLLEVLISALLLGFLGVGSMFMVANSNKILNASVKQSMANTNVQSIMRDLSNDIKGGYILKSDGGSNLVIEYTDGKNITWFFKGEQLYRTDKNGKTKQILLFGAKDVEIRKGTFIPTKNGKYYKADIEFRMFLDDGNTFEVGNVSNTFYCRLQEEGFIL